MVEPLIRTFQGSEATWSTTADTNHGGADCALNWKGECLPHSWIKRRERSKVNWGCGSRIVSYNLVWMLQSGIMIDKNASPVRNRIRNYRLSKNSLYADACKRASFQASLSVLVDGMQIHASLRPCHFPRDNAQRKPISIHSMQRQLLLEKGLLSKKRKRRKSRNQAIPKPVRGFLLSSTDVCHCHALNGADCFMASQSGLARKHLHSIPRVNMPGWTSDKN